MRQLDHSIAAFLSAVLAVTVVACARHPTGSPGAAPMFNDDHGLLTVPPGSPLRTHMVVAPVMAGEGVVANDLPAEVEADPARIVNISSPLTGRVVAVKVALGQHVQRGQTLAIVASGDFAGAVADDEKADSALALASAQLARAKGVRDAGGSADKDVEAAQSAFDQARAEMTRARMRLDSLSAKTRVARGGDLVLSAPLDGVVTTLAIAPGSQVSDPTATLMTVANLDRVFVTVSAPETDAGHIAVGTPAQISLASDPDHPLSAKVTEADALVQPDTRRQKVRIALANSEGRLLPNMYASVRLGARSSPTGAAVFVPQSALLMNNDSITVLVEVRPWVFARRAVKLGDETETSALVLEGLKAGERVVVAGGVLLDD